MRNSDRELRMAIMPEVETRFSVVADQAAAPYTEVTACQGGQTSAPKIIGGVRWQQDGRETLEILPGRFQCLLPNDLSQRSIHCLRSREYFGDIGLQDHDVRSLRITTRVLSAYRLREIVIAFHRSLFRSTGFFFHKISVLATLREITCDSNRAARCLRL